MSLWHSRYIHIFLNHLFKIKSAFYIYIYTGSNIYKLYHKYMYTNLHRYNFTKFLWNTGIHKSISQKKWEIIIISCGFLYNKNWGRWSSYSFLLIICIVQRIFFFVVNFNIHYTFIGRLPLVLSVSQKHKNGNSNDQTRNHNNNNDGNKLIVRACAYILGIEKVFKKLSLSINDSMNL